MFIKNKHLIDSDGKYVQTIDNEFFLTADSVDIASLPTELIKAIKRFMIKPVYRLYLLNQDESIRDDISEYLIEGGNYDVNYQSGVRRNLKVSLMNADGVWNPNPIYGRIWKGSKFRFDIGLVVRSSVYWHQSGIYALHSTLDPNESSNRRIDLTLMDKFTLLNGVLGGKTEFTYEIPVGTKIKDAIQSLLLLDKGNGTSFDLKPLHFPYLYENAVTAYTIKKTPNDSIGQIILDLTQMISCDVYYNETGELVVESGTDMLASTHSSVLWEFKDTDKEYIQNPLERNFSDMINKVIVVGANINGKVFSARSENKNPMSPCNIHLMPDVNFEYIEDSNISSDELAQDLADYKLHKASVSGLSISFICTFMPHLNVNKTILISNKNYNFKRSPFTIQSLSMPIGSGATMNLSITNNEELPF